MKIVICGKGGSGKSTVSALMAREMAARGDQGACSGHRRVQLRALQAAWLRAAQGLHGLSGRQEGAWGEDEKIHEIGGQRRSSASWRISPWRIFLRSLSSARMASSWWP